jgi:hypothetical protein
MEVARVTAEQYLEPDNERVLVLFYVGERGKGSGLEIGQFARLLGKAAHLFHLRDGTVTRMVVYWGHRRAFADVGLEG